MCMYMFMCVCLRGGAALCCTYPIKELASCSIIICRCFKSPTSPLPGSVSFPSWVHSYPCKSWRRSRITQHGPPPLTKSRVNVSNKATVECLSFAAGGVIGASAPGQLPRDEKQVTNLRKREAEGVRVRANVRC